MSNEENYIIENEVTDTAKKQEYWNTGIGLNKVDNLEPSKYLLDLSQKNINGELKYYEVENLLKTYYETQEQIINNDFESDKENLISQCREIALQKINECDIIKKEKVSISRNAGIVHVKVVLELEKDITYES